MCWRVQLADGWSWHAQVYDTVWEHAARRHGLAGSLYWHCAAASYPDYDGTTVYLQPAQPPGPDEARVLGLIQGHARAMAGCSALPASPPVAAGQQASPSHRSHTPVRLMKSLGRSIRDKLELR